MIDQTKYYFQSLEQNAIRQEFKYELAAHSPEDLLSYRIRSHAFTDWVSAANFREKEIAYLIMRQQYAQYGQIFDDRFSSAISIAFPPLLHSPLNKDCSKDEFKVDEVVDQLDSEGYTILPNFV